MDENQYIETLISEVQSRPYLWSKADRSYKDTIKFRNAWTAIGEKLDSTAEKVKSKWQNLRDQYTRTNRKLPSGSGGKVESRWPWYSSLSFLGSGTEKRETVSNLVDDSQNVEANEEQSDQKSEADDSASRTETPKSSKSTESKITKKRPAPTDAVDSAIIQYLTNKKDKSDDEDMLFAKSIGTSIAKLPPRIKRRVKIGIMQLINQAEEEHEQEAAATYTRPITFTSQPSTAQGSFAIPGNVYSNL